MKVINNADVTQLVSQNEMTATLEKAYQDLFSGRAVCRPRIDIEIPSSLPEKFLDGALWKAVVLESILRVGASQISFITQNAARR